MEHYFGVAKEQDIRYEEIGAVQSIVMAVSAGRVRAQFREARIRNKEVRTAGRDAIKRICGKENNSRMTLFLR